jgi:hypothetical protein
MSTVSSTFIIRLWTAADPLSAERPRGHGRIDHVQSGDHAYFDDLEDAVEFLRRHFGAFDGRDPAMTVADPASPAAPPESPSPPDLT